MLHKELDHIVATLVCGTHERSTAVQQILRIHVGAQIEQQLHRFKGGRRRPLVSNALHPANSARNHQRSDLGVCRN